MSKTPTLRRVAMLLSAVIGRALAFIGIFALLSGKVEAHWVFVALFANLILGLAPKRLAASPSSSPN